MSWNEIIRLQRVLIVIIIIPHLISLKDHLYSLKVDMINTISWSHFGISILCSVSKFYYSILTSFFTKQYSIRYSLMDTTNFEYVYFCITLSCVGQCTESSPKVNSCYIPPSFNKTRLIISVYFFSSMKRLVSNVL